MKKTNPQHHPDLPTAATAAPPHPRDYAPIELAGGWSGRVLAAGSTNFQSLPTLDAWRQWLAVLIDDPASLPRSSPLKYSESVEVLRADGPPLSRPGSSPIHVVCKRTSPGSLTDRMLAPFRPSRARRNFDRAFLLHHAGILTATPLAILERARSQRTSWLVTTHLDGVIDLDTFVLTKLPRLSPDRAAAAKSALAAALAELLARLHRARLHHRDLKASNILIAQSGLATDDPPQLYLVDLDGFSPRPFGRPGLRWQPLYRLAASLIAYPAVTRADHARCLREYLRRCDENPDDRRKRFRMISRKAIRYASDSRRRKAGKLDGDEPRR